MINELIDDMEIHEKGQLLQKQRRLRFCVYLEAGWVQPAQNHPCLHVILAYWSCSHANHSVRDVSEVSIRTFTAGYIRRLHVGYVCTKRKGEEKINFGMMFRKVVSTWLVSWFLNLSGWFSLSEWNSYATWASIPAIPMCQNLSSQCQKGVSQLLRKRVPTQDCMLVSWYKKSQLGKKEISHNTLMSLSILTYTEVIPETAPESDTSFLQHKPIHQFAH